VPNGDSSGTVKNDLDTTVGLWSAWGRGLLSLAHSFLKDYFSTHAKTRPTLEAFFESARKNKQHLNSNYDRIRYDPPQNAVPTTDTRALSLLKDWLILLFRNFSENIQKYMLHNTGNVNIRLENGIAESANDAQ
jgi:hypothetical protein